MDDIDTFYYVKDADGVTDLPDTDGVKLTMLDGSSMFVPNDTRNRHWQLYQEWLSVPNTIQSE